MGYISRTRCVRSPLKLVDKRNTDKRKDAFKLAHAKEESCIIYVRGEEMLDLLLTKLLPESIEGIARHDETTSEAAEEIALLQATPKSGELRAIASSSTFSLLGRFSVCSHTSSSAT